MRILYQSSLILLLAACLTALPATEATAPTAAGYDVAVAPLLEQYCFSCHGERMKGDLDLRGYHDAASVTADRETFERVVAAIEHREMPPDGKPQPTSDERTQILEWLQVNLFPVDCTNPDPGRVTIRRLNRAEYNNTIRDLVGVDFKPAKGFPADDAGYGFDNIGDVLSLSPVLFEKYLTAAETILDKALAADPASTTRMQQRIIPPNTVEEMSVQSARTIIRRFARRAYRRPLSREETARLFELFEAAQAEGEGMVDSIKSALLATLVSPHFLFRGEWQPEPDSSTDVHPIDEFALASRLSYFLWSSMPDDRLFTLARSGRLRANLDAQVQRMLRDPRTKALVENFAGQWLQLRNLDIMDPDPGIFPDFDDALRQAMRRETELFFETVLRQDGSILDFLQSDYTFVNARLAQHYALENIEGDGFQRVNLAGTHRGGVLTHASILTLTSNPTRTSPVKRGKWVLDNLLGTPPSPPPPDVPELDDQSELTGTLRERLEQHRNNPNCITCHERMDPIGFGLEHFDGIGAWRDQDGSEPIDAAGRLVSGETFAGIDELRTILAENRKEDFVQCLSSKMLTYALGRGLEYYDRCAVERIAQKLGEADYRFSALVLEIVKSAPFQLRRGESSP